MSAPAQRKVRPATLADVGRAAGVSAMAASVVLNHARTSSRISTETRARILDAAQRLNYRPNAAARALVARRMNTIGVAAVLDAGELNTYFLELFNGILDGAAIHEQNTTVFTLHNWVADAKARLPRFCDGRIDGLILVAPLLGLDVARALPEHTPFVAIHSNVALPGVVNLESDEETGAYELVRHLISLGHRRILHFSGGRGLRGAERRIRGYERAMQEARIAREADWVVDCGYTTPAGRASMRAWLRTHKSRPLPEAIFCGNDGVAAGVLEVLAEHGIAVPGEISVAGFDDSLAARTTSPQLTTVRQPLRAMGRRAVEALLVEVGRSTPPPPSDSETSIVFPTELVLRQSVAERRKAKGS